jgi:hypothetical protein
MLRSLFLVAGLVLGIGCATGNGPQVDPCKRAFERLDRECGFKVDGVDALELHCTGQSACVAACLEESPCSDIRHGGGEYADCMNECE